MSLIYRFISLKKVNRDMLIRNTHFLPLNGIKGKITRSSFTWDLRKKMYEFMATRLESNISSLLGVIDDFYIRMYEDGNIAEAKIIGHIRHGIFGGSAFSDCMKPFIPQSEYIILNLGENESRFGEVLHRIVATQDRVDRLRSKIISSLAGPLLMLTVFYGLMYIIGTQVGPSVSSLLAQQHLPNDQVPIMVRIMINTGTFFSSIYSLIPWFFLLIFVPIFLYVTPRWTGPYRVLFDRMFPFSFYKDFHGFQWYNSFLAMMIAGSSDITILEKQAEMASPWLAERLISIRKSMENGQSMINAMIGNRIAYYFPNKNIIYDANCVADRIDYPERMVVLLQQWSERFERRIETISSITAFSINMLMYTGLIMVALGTNALSSLIGHS